MFKEESLRGGEHYSLQYSHFKFRANGQGFDVNIPQSKTNQRGINGSLNDEKLRIPYHPMIMETYNKYFSKRPGNADKEFYLREYVAEDDYIIYNHWFQKFHVGKK
ncbi:unnamed protein product [Rhizophagus irregularis]|nr:unnamed protein product [Rhizophagus irregularis]